jgi:DNA-binding NtrC family response regulator
MSSDNGLKGCRVLIVEDEYFLASDLENALKSHGAIVVGPIDDFGDALGQVERGHFDVAILDINLHDEKTYPIADILMRLRIPFVLYTGYAVGVIPERFADVMLWQKPLDTSELIRHIGQLCQRGSLVD